MSEQLLIENLDQAVDTMMSNDPVRLVLADARLLDLLSLVEDLRRSPRESFRTQLKEELGRASMTTEAQPAVEKKTASREGYSSITPYLRVERAESLVGFVKQAFGAVEVVRTTGSGGLHVEVIIGDSRLMIGGKPGITELPTALHIYVPDADAVYHRAMEAGGTSLEEPVDQFYGDREAGIKDPTGNVWWIATHKLGPAETHIPEGLGTVTPFLHPVGAAKLIDFMKDAFAAEEVSRDQSPDGMIQHATVRIGDSMIELGEAHGEAQPMPPALYMYVENVDASYESALKAGATSLRPPTDQGYGDRTAWVKDAWGHTWFLATAVKQ